MFCAIVMSRILYALPAWGGFLTYELPKLTASCEKLFDGDSVAITSV